MTRSADFSSDAVFLFVGVALRPAELPAADFVGAGRVGLGGDTGLITCGRATVLWMGNCFSTDYTLYH